MDIDKRREEIKRAALQRAAEALAEHANSHNVGNILYAYQLLKKSFEEDRTFQHIKEYGRKKKRRNNQ